MRRLLGFSLIAACSARVPAPADPSGPRPEPTLEQDQPPSFSPQPDSAPDALLAPMCAEWDAALQPVAQELAENAANGGVALEASDVEAKLREHGAPYVWPRAWTLAGGPQLLDELRPRLEPWLAQESPTGKRRCGGAIVKRAATRLGAALVVVDALADLAPLPARVRVGSWVSVEANFLVPHAGAKVIVLGPRGRPRPVPTAVDGGAVRARFAADYEGPWLVQVLGDVAGGPRQVLQALLMAGEGARLARATPAPGEGAAASSDAAGLLAMLNAARASERITGVASDAELNRLAAEQAEALRSARRVAHDLGGGDPQTRVAAAGLDATIVGENVAHANTLAHAHRALWSSPSHRANMLDDRFDTVGIGVAVDSDDSVWVCELFARLAP
ncbi:MAG: CAP domain-containing protein [Myxococcota bacterium]